MIPRNKSVPEVEKPVFVAQDELGSDAQPARETEEGEVQDVPEFDAQLEVLPDEHESEFDEPTE